MTALADEIALAFLRSRADGVPIAPPHCERTYDLQGAYYVQRRFVHAYQREGDRSVAGYKLSATSPAAQAALSIPEPLIGVLFSDEVQRSGSTVGLSAFHRPVAEAEVAFVLQRDLPELCSRDVILDSTAVQPAIELADSRMQGWPHDVAAFSPQDIVADNAFSGRLVVGEPIPARELDVLSVGVELSHGGGDQRFGSTPAVIRVDPISLIGWLSRGVHRIGGRLERGMIIASGAIAGPAPVGPGTVAADFGPLGTVTVTLAADDRA